MTTPNAARKRNPGLGLPRTRQARRPIVPGRFFGIGLGPGDPELLTIRAQRLLRQCDVVCVPKGSENTEGLALSVLKKLKTPTPPEVITMTFPMTTDAGRLAAAWAESAAIIVRKLKEGKDVAFVTEGDPSLYSTFIYVYQSVKALYPEAGIEIVPGVSSITAAAARSLTPLAAGNERLAIMPATGNIQPLESALDNFDAAVFLKVNRNLDKLLDLIEKKGLLTKAVLVTRCHLPGEQVHRDVGKLRGTKIDYFSLLIVRKN
ncbi:MAG: precorrin-2 C(20)-methyltransferase [Chloroflexi bacterium]|nr:precorrin-2 C(20)-methyltransferase [Chloroflexota bacterium]